MDAQTLGQTIIRLRKKAGMTQEALGKAVSVSTQAVSRWERGGSPDLGILCTLADVFGVSVDMLLNHHTVGKGLTINQLLQQELLTVPEEQRMKRTWELAWEMMKITASSFDPTGDSCYRLMTASENPDRTEAQEPESVPIVTYVAHDSGLMQAATASDFQYLLLMPDPERGFASIMKTPDAYRELFAFLAKPNRLEMFTFLYNVKEGAHFTASLAAQKLGLSEEEAETILAEMAELRLANDYPAQTAEGAIHIYQRCFDTALIPFLYFATELMHAQDFVNLVQTRGKPFLSAPLGTGALSPDWRTKEYIANHAENGQYASPYIVGNTY